MTRKNTWPNGTPGRRNRGLIKVVSFKVTEDMHEAILEYIATQEELDDTYRVPKGAPYGTGMADYIRRILADFLAKELGREIPMYEYEDGNA